MGASSSGLLDEAKMSAVKGLVEGMLKNFGDFYEKQYSAAYFGHIHQEVEPKKEGRGLLLKQRPQYAPDEVLHQSNVKFSCWYEQGKKSRGRYIVLKRDYRVEIHESMETFNHGSSAKLVIHPVGGTVFISEEESRAHLEKTCAGLLNGVKEDSSSVVSSPDLPAVYLHLPYTGYTCFLFKLKEERDNFLSALESCIRHCNLEPWSESSYENQAFIRALQLYRQDRGCYESWEMLLGAEEHVLTNQMMEEVLPWLQSQLQSKLKGKKTERIRLWLATVHATHVVVFPLITAGLEALKVKCHHAAFASQTLIRADLDQITSSLSFLEEKIRVCVREEAETVHTECVAPYLLSIIEVLAENTSAGIEEMQQTLHTQIDSAFTHKNGGGTEETKETLFSLRSISLEQCYEKVKNLTELLVDLKQRFGLSSVQRLVHSALLEMERLLDRAVYTLELFLQSARMQSSEILVKTERATKRVLKQLDYDSKVVQKKFYHDALLEITLPVVIKRMDNKWRTDLQQFEQYIFSDYSSFILVRNVYDNVLRSILSAQIEAVVQEAMTKKSKNPLVDISDLAFSQYSLLGQASLCPTTDGQVSHTPAEVTADGPSAAVKEEGPLPQSDPQLHPEPKSDLSPAQSSDHNMVVLPTVTIVTKDLDEPTNEEDSHSNTIQKNGHIESDAPSTTDSADSATPELLPARESVHSCPDSSEPSLSSLLSLLSNDASSEVSQRAQTSASDHASEDTGGDQSSHPVPTHPPPDSPTKISLESLNRAIVCNGTEDSVTEMTAHGMADRAVYLTGQIKESWDLERLKEEKQAEAETTAESGERKDDEQEASENEKQTEDEENIKNEGCHTGNEEEEEKLLQTPEPVESQAEYSPQPSQDSVAIIRELVTEVTEVEIDVTPCPDSSNTPSP